MTGTADGEPVTGGGAVTLDIQPIDLASVIDARLDVEEGSYPRSYNALYDGHAPQTSDILILEDVRPIAPWGGYLLSVDDLTVTFVDEYGVSHVGVVDMELGDGADLAGYRGDIRPARCLPTRSSPSALTGGSPTGTAPTLRQTTNPRYELDHDWRPADFGEVGGITCVIGDPDDLDDALRIVPELLDGYESHFSDRQFASALCGSRPHERLDWELLVEFYDYDSLAAGNVEPQRRAPPLRQHERLGGPPPPRIWRCLSRAWIASAPTSSASPTQATMPRARGCLPRPTMSPSARLPSWN